MPMSFDAILLIEIAAVSLGTGLVLLALARMWMRRSAAVPPRSVRGGGMTFLFDGTALVDASPEGRQFLAALDRQEDHWIGLWAALKPRFPGLPRHPDQAAGPGYDAASAQGVIDAARLDVERWGSVLRLTLREPSTQSDAALTTQLVHSLTEDRNTLAEIADSAPEPMWKADADGHVLWANPAYWRLSDRMRFNRHDTGTTPPRALFHGQDGSTGADLCGRRALTPPDTGKELWFDVSQSRAEDGAWYGHATSIDRVVQAEVAQRNFVQTLTKTFAHLSTGLAIFDRERRLALFNPALIDLTHLSPEFLSARPKLQSFFDQLRDHQIMPEPKNYADWRDQISDLVMAAINGVYSETWTLASGQTYRLSGRPHPDGAIAFLLEDISAEVSLTRRFRAEMEQNQLVLDTLHEALAVFSSEGVLMMTNAAYRSLWDCDPDSSFAAVTILDATRHWMDASEPSPVWGDLRDFVGASGERLPWQTEVVLKSGQPMTCSISPISGGGTLIGFLPVSGMSPTVASRRAQPSVLL